MGLSSELKKIKKLYGEEFMHYCRQNFPTILDEQGELLKILQSIFAGNSKIKLADVEEEAVLKDYIYAKYNKEVNVEEIDTGKTPYELLDEKGYTLYECRTEDEIQSYKRYYYPGEELCTFNGGRLKQCICFFAVRKNVDDIKREEEAEEMIKRELTFTSPQGTKTKEEQSPDVSDMLTPKIPEMDLDAMNEMRKKLEEFNRNR